MDSHADPFGVAATPVPGLTAIRSDGPGELHYAISRPLVALVVQDSKRHSRSMKTLLRQRALPSMEMQTRQARTRRLYQSMAAAS